MAEPEVVQAAELGKAGGRRALVADLSSIPGLYGLHLKEPIEGTTFHLVSPAFSHRPSLLAFPMLSLLRNSSHGRIFLKYQTGQSYIQRPSGVKVSGGFTEQVIQNKPTRK